MKNFFTLILLFLLSCSSDEEIDRNELKGTTWVYGKNECKLSFISPDECHLFINMLNLNEDDYYYYKLDYPNIEIYEKEDHSIIYKLEFLNNGNLALIDADLGDYLLELRKQ